MKVNPPSPNEIEVIVFGPGYGESILIHLGDNKWLVVDSCLDPKSKIPYPISYLEKIGLNPAEVIKYIVATHWHDDHIKGLSYIVDQCLDAEFICSSAIRSIEFLSLVSLYSKRTMMQESGIDEFSKIVNTIKSNKRQPKLSIADRLLVRIKDTDTSFGLNCSIHSLSPSDYAVLKALEDISKLLPEDKTPKVKITNFNPNHTSVVLLIKIGELAILLGADLEELGIADTGWTKIINSDTRPSFKACLYKIPHHGSVTADHPDIWNELIDTKFNAVITPFRRGSISLPSNKDIERIKNKTGQNITLLTSSPQWQKSKRRDNAVQRSINESGIKLRELKKAEGYVSFRMDVTQNSNQWNVALFGQAAQI